MSLAGWLLIGLVVVVALLAFIGWKYPDKRSQKQRDEEDSW